MRRLLLALLVIVSCVGLGVWLMWPRLVGLARDRAVAALAREIQRPVHVDAVTLSILPLHLELHGLVIGTESAMLGRIGSVDARLWAIPSLTQLRPVFSVRIDSVLVDLTQFPASSAGPHEQRARGTLPSVRLRELVLTDGQLRFRLRGAPTTLLVARATGHLDSRAHPEHLSASLAVTGTQLERQNRHLNVATIDAQGGFDAAGLFLDTANLSGEAINVSLQKLRLARRYEVTAAIDLTPLSAFIDESIAGAVKLDGTLAGDLINPDAEAQLAIRDIAVARHTIGNLTAQLTRKGQALRVANMDLSDRVGHLTGTAELQTANDFPVHGQLDLQEFDVDTLLATFGRPLDFHNQLTASATLNGTLRPLHVALTASGAAQRTDRQPPQQVATLQLSGAAEPEAVQLQLVLAQSQNRLDARVDLRGERIDGQMTLRAPDLAELGTILPASLERLRLTGRLQSTVTLSGVAAHPAIAADVTASELTVVGAPVRQIAGSAAIQGAILTTPGVHIDTGTGSAEVTGQVALGATPDNDWRVSIRGLDTDFLAAVAHGFTSGAVPVSGGRIDGSIHTQGPWPHAQVEANVSATTLYVFQEPLDRVEVSGRARLPEWTVHASVTHTANESVTLDGSGSGTRGQLTVESTPIHVANFRGASRRRATGTLVLHARLAGALQAPEGTLDASATNLGIDGRAFGDVLLRGTGKESQWLVTATAFADTAELNAKLGMGAMYPYSLNVKLRDVQLARLISTDPSLQVAVAGEIALNGSLRTLASPSGSVRLTRFEAERGEYRVAAAEPIRIDADAGRFQFRSFVLAAHGSRLTLTGECTTDGRFDVQASGAGDLVLLELIGRPFNAARGEFTVTAHVRHLPESAWDLSGEAQLHDTTLDLGLPIAFTETNGHFTLVGSRVRVDALDGKAGGGQFHVDGAVDLGQGPQLAWRFREISVAPTPGLEARVSGKGEVRGTWKVLTVRGDVEIPTALYDRDIELVDIVPFFREQVKPAPRTEAPAVQVEIDLHIHAPGGLYIDNNIAKAELSSDLRITGVIDKPQLIGTIEFITGEVTFRQRTFTVTAGTIEFRDRLRINPLLNITADSQISTADADYTVTVSVTGTADNPRVQFGADDPNLSQNDIVSLITFGKTMAQLQREGGGVSAADALALLPTGAVTGRLGKLIGVNRFEVEAVQSRTAGSVEPRVTIGKDITDQFRASVSSSFGVTAQRIVQLEYRWTPRISLLGSWEGQTESQAGAFGGDIKFRYEFRRLPFSLLSGLPGGLETRSRGAR